MHCIFRNRDSASREPFDFFAFLKRLLRFSFSLFSLLSLFTLVFVERCRSLLCSALLLLLLSPRVRNALCFLHFPLLATSLLPLREKKRKKQVLRQFVFFARFHVPLSTNSTCFHVWEEHIAQSETPGKKLQLLRLKKKRKRDLTWRAASGYLVIFQLHGGQRFRMWSMLFC
jgi:hypothetical protein